VRRINAATLRYTSGPRQQLSLLPESGLLTERENRFNVPQASSADKTENGWITQVVMLKSSRSDKAWLF
jgi:hypothetical protein